MPAVLFSLKRSFVCKTESTEVHDPTKGSKDINPIQRRKPIKSGCSKIASDLRDLIHCSKRYTEKQGRGGGGSSPRSIRSSEILNPLTHEVILNASTCEFQITGFGAKKGANFDATLKKQGTPGLRSRSARMSGKSTFGHFGASANDNLRRSDVSDIINSRSFRETGIEVSSNLVCEKCDEQFKDLEAVEVHHLSHHSVTELPEGDSSRKIVELICGTSWSKSEDRQIMRVLKVHNTQKTLAQFEEHREMVKMKASKLSKKHPRCQADGNELLRFHGTVVACSLGANGLSGLCTSETCGVCKILRHGFSTLKHPNGYGVFTTCSSTRSLESIEVRGGNACLKRALIVCRVIAGRVHRPLEYHKETTTPSGFDSMAGKFGHQSNMEELYLLNPKALLPCFVIICGP